MTADAYLPHTVTDLPATFVFQPGGRLRDSIRHYVQQGVVRVIAGPVKCHVIIDIRRPYYRPVAALEAET